MTRGRRKDLTIPPSRALLQQRDYRARKAQYVTDLEERVRRVEEENARLRKEVDVLRLRAAAPGSMGPSPEVVRTVYIPSQRQTTDSAQFFLSEGHRVLRADAPAHRRGGLPCPLPATHVCRAQQRRPGPCPRTSADAVTKPPTTSTSA